MKTWNLGNTTVRNPERIKAGLRLLKEHFEGKVFDLASQREFFEILLKQGLIEGNPPQEKNRAASGRKWQSVCYKLGFIHRSKRVNGIISITEAGNALLGNDAIESDIFLRQLLKVQLPSPTEQRFDGAKIHPFYLVLGVAIALNDAGMKPLSKEEIGLFMQSATSDDQAHEVVGLIKDYRARRDGITGRVDKRRYYLEQRAAKAKLLDLEESTLEDYADTTARYSVITGIFTFGGRQSLVIKEDRLNLARAVVNAGPLPILQGTEFLAVFHNPNLPALPTDNVDFLERDITELTKRLNELSQQTGTAFSEQPIIEGATILQLKRKREDLEQELVAKKEIQFYRTQSSEEQIEDIKSLFESIEGRETIGGSDYRPAWAEWGVWRVFLSINTITSPISETRGFKINSELFPIHHAKGGAADLCFKYGDGAIIPAEITLSTNERQYNMEGEAVKFHIKSIAEANQDSEIVGVFTAPDIHVATAHEFFNAEFYSKKLDKVMKLDIVPLTFEQLKSFLPGQKNGCKSGEDLLDKLRGLMSLKEQAINGAVWLQSINQTLGV